MVTSGLELLDSKEYVKKELRRQIEFAEKNPSRIESPVRSIDLEVGGTPNAEVTLEPIVTQGLVETPVEEDFRASEPFQQHSFPRALRDI